jgi:hypothetical protein
MGEISKLGWLMGLIKQAMWTDSLYFLYLLLLLLPSSESFQEFNILCVSPKHYYKVHGVLTQTTTLY